MDRLNEGAFALARLWRDATEAYHAAQYPAMPPITPPWEEWSDRQRDWTIGVASEALRRGVSIAVPEPGVRTMDVEETRRRAKERAQATGPLGVE